MGCANWASLVSVEVKNFTEASSTQDELAKQLAEFEIIVAMRERTRFDAALFERLPRLKLLVTTGMYNAAIDMAAAAARGILICGTRGLAYPAPELTWGLLLALSRYIPAEADSIRQGGKWQTYLGSGLSGKTLGIIGLGKIGTQIARYAHAFNMPVLGWSRSLTDDRCKAAGAKSGRLAWMLCSQRSDIVTLHMVLADSTRGMIGARELGLLKPTALLVNTSRGPLIDEAALVEALTQNRIAGAALRRLRIQNRCRRGHPFCTLPNVVATPHIGYVTRENYQIFYGDAVEDIQAWLKGSPLRTLPAPK